jgi:hypothetical protein
MTIETSHGKARPSLVRSDDLRLPPKTDAKRSDGRDENGRFAPGTRAALGARFKATHVVRSLMGGAS